MRLYFIFCGGDAATVTTILVLGSEWHVFDVEKRPAIQPYGPPYSTPVDCIELAKYSGGDPAMSEPTGPRRCPDKILQRITRCSSSVEDSIRASHASRIFC